MWSMKAYYKIGELSKIYDIGKDSLMYYEELGILKPSRDSNGYRLYSISDIWKLNLIKELRTLDVPMKRIKNYVDFRTVQNTKEMLYEEVELIDERIEELLRHKNNIQARLHNIEEVMKETAINQIREVYLPKRKAVILSADITRDADVDILMQKLQKEYETQFDIIGKKSIGAIFDQQAIENHQYNLFESVFCLLDEEEENYQLILEEGHYLVYTYRGPYKDNGLYIEEMLHYMDKKQYKPIGKTLEIYKIDIHETALEDEFTTEIQIPYEKK